MYCPRCGQPITPDDTSCPRCRLVFTTDRQYAPRAAPPPRKLPLAWKLVLGAVVLLFLTASPVLIILLFAEDLGGEEPDLLPGSMPTTASPREPFATPTDAPNGSEEAIGPGDVRFHWYR
ncbi:zinc ribbon domain-containing protein [Nocardioides allogilvus]|uniref:zinc ribbon domain-containing protein n=1 Tax=Nocardioides allogilvus TaxID=2072017 RepID=UPI000D2F7CC9|nr:zinc ribbon domain-containing protein [Nocardioides allogilvus]